MNTHTTPEPTLAINNMTPPQAPAIRWYRSPVEKPLLEGLRQKSNIQGMAHVLAHLALLAGSGSLSYVLLESNHWVLGLLCLLVHGMFYSFLGWAGAGHELNHHTVFASRSLNQFFLRLFSFLTWNNYIFFRASHGRHHRLTVYSDLDFEVRLPQQLDYKSWLFSLTFDFPALGRALKITWDNSRGIIRGKWGNDLFPISDGAARRKLFRWARCMLIGHSLLALIFILSGTWKLLLIVTFAPFICTWLNKILAQAQHFGMQANVPDFRQNSRTILLNPFLAFLYWQMNYHIEHHMYPAVPFFNLKKLRRVIDHDLPAPTHGVRGAVQEMVKSNAAD